MSKNKYGMSKRQIEVWSYMAQGYSHTGIAKLLKVKKSTILTHVSRIYQVLGLYGADDDINQYTAAALMYLKRDE